MALFLGGKIMSDTFESTINLEERKEYSAIEPVPIDKRSISALDMFATWVGANANNGTWYVGGVIAALCFIPSLYVTLIANPIAYIIMALVGYIGYKIGISTMALTRITFGVKGSIIPSLLNTTQFIGWTAVNTFIASISVSFLLKDLFGMPVFGEPGGNTTMLIGICIMSVLHLLSIASGHRSVKIVERIGVGLIILLVIWETVVVFQQVSLDQIINWRPPADKALPFGSAIDIMAAFSLGWTPAIAEFTRYCKTKTAATWVPMLGANIGLFWFTLIGSIVTIGVAISTGAYDPNNSDPSGIVSKLGLGVLAFLVIIITSTTANAINLMASGISLTNVIPKLKALPALWIVTAIAAFITLIPLYIGSFLESFTMFLDYIGMVFGPIFAIVITDYYLLHNKEQSTDDLNKKNGRYWFSGGFNIRAVVIWAIGVILFLLLRNAGFVTAYTGATYPAMIITGILYFFFAKKTA